MRGLIKLGHIRKMHPATKERHKHINTTNIQMILTQPGHITDQSPTMKPQKAFKINIFLEATKRTINTKAEKDIKNPGINGLKMLLKLPTQEKRMLGPSSNRGIINHLPRAFRIRFKSRRKVSLPSLISRKTRIGARGSQAPPGPLVSLIFQME